MERNRVANSSQVSVRRARGWLVLGTITLVGLIALALVLSLAGSALPRLSWAGALVVLGGTALLASGVVRRLVPRLPGLAPGKRPLLRAVSLLAALLPLLLSSALPVQAAAFVVTISPTTSVVAGTRVSFLVSVMAGQDSDVDFTITPSFHGGSATLVEWTQPASGSCSSSGNQVVCDIGAMYTTDTAGIGVTYDLASSYVRTGGDQLSIRVDLHDATSDRNYDFSSAFGVTTKADVTVAKLGGRTAQAGENFEYQIVVDNLGPSDARSVTVWDDILSSENIDFISASGCTITGSGNDRELECDLGTMAPLERGTINVTVRSDETADINNTVLVESDEPDPMTMNNRATAFTSVTDMADLEVTKTTAATSVTAGQTINYTVLVTNTGPSTAENVVVYDTLPPYIGDNVQISAAQGECTPGTPPTSPAICNLGTLASGGSTTVNVTFELDPSYPIDPLLGASIQNEVLVTSDTFDPDNGNNRASVETTVEGLASVPLTAADVSVVPTTITAGDEFHIDIRLENNGPSTAQDSALEVTLPTFVEILNVSSASPPFSAFSACTTRVGDNSVRCELGDLRPSEPITGTLNLRVKADTAPGTYANAVDVTFSKRTPGSLITLLLDLLVDAKADLAIVKLDTGSPATAGLTTNYVFAVVNLGPSDAENVTVDDTLPAGFTYLDGTDDCSGTAGGFTCDLGDMAAGGSSQFLVTVEIDPSVDPGDHTDTATVSSDTDDPDTSNNTDTQVTYVQDIADLWVRKFGRPDQIVVAGELMTYTIQVDNLGPSDARNVVVTDTLDPDLTFVSSTPAPVDPNPPADPLTGEKDFVYNLGTIADLGRAEIQIVVQANRDIGPPFDPITNRVEAQTTAQDPNPYNNLTERVTSVTAHSDLQVTKTAVGQNVQDSATAPAPLQEQADKVTAGTFITYTINVTNTGPSDAANVFVQDYVPTQIEPRGAIITRGDGLVGSCLLGGLVDGSVQCNIDTLGVTPAITSSATVVITGFVASSVPEDFFLNNNVSVGSDNYDPDNSNSIFQNQTQVNARADLVISKTGDPETVVAGDLPASLGGVTDGKLLKYTITVTNTGPSDALNVVVSDTLPVDTSGNSQVVFLNSTLKSAFGAEQCSADSIHSESVTCTVGTMTVDQVVSFDILVFVKPDVVQAGEAFHNITNTADVLSDTADPVDSNNQATRDTRVEAKADLIITKTDTPDPVVAGQQVFYIVTFSNQGPSTARTVTVTDTLPAGIAFNRCEAIDPDDEVTCSPSGSVTTGQTVTLDQLKVRGTVQLPGDLDPGEGYAFAIVADVDSGYVLDNGPFDPLNPTTNPINPARDTAYIASETTSGVGDYHPDVNPDDNQDTELTAVQALADLIIEKTDSAAGFLSGDPVTQGTVFTYTLTISNTGPSDAASVQVYDQLPQGLILDPAVVSPTIGISAPAEADAAVLYVLDTGLIKVELGRMNVGSEAEITIQVRVAETTPSSTLTNTAFVVTEESTRLTFPADSTPTADPDLTNNAVTETTAVVSPAVTIDKTISLDGVCPGTNNVAIGFIGQPVTYCYEVTNSGDTYLDYLTVMDFVTTVSSQGVITITNQQLRSTPGGDPLLPIAPGDTFMISTTVESDILTDCNDRPDTALAFGVPVNSGRTVLQAVFATVAFATERLGDLSGVVGDTDDALIETPCQGVDWRLQLPALDTVNCETWIQVQNVGNRFTKAALVIWGDPGPCPPQSAGPLKIECTGLLRPGSAWTWINNQLPAGAKSGILYALNTTDTVTDGRGNQLNFADLACLALGRSIVGDYEEWLLFDTAYRNRGTYFAYSRSGDNNLDVDVLDFGAHQGEPTAVSVNRACPGDNTPSVDVHAAYTAFSTDQEGLADPIAGGYAYYAPLVWATYGAPPDDLSTILHIQNSGVECTSVEIWFQGQDNCVRYTVGDILALAPGEAYQFDPNTVVGPGWQGSIWIASSQPLGVLVDIIGRDLFGSYRGVPADSFVGFGDENNPNTFSLGSLVNYAPLIYREFNGWDTGIQVQNLSSTYSAKVKVYFVDSGGDTISTIVDWICPRGSQTFLLAAIANLPGSYVGSARIESQDWWSPGDPGVDAPVVQSVVNTVKYQDLTRATPLELVAYNALQEQFGYDWQLGLEHPGMGTLAVPLIARGNRGVTSELALQNLNPNPGFTDFAIFIYDQNRLIDFVCQKLNEKQVEYIDVDLWGTLPQGFLGSVVVQAQFSTQLGEAALGAVAVERIGRTLSDPDLPGDESKAFEAFPLFNRFKVEPGVQCPGLP